jgi:hypothetical protein
MQGVLVKSIGKEVPGAAASSSKCITRKPGPMEKPSEFMPGRRVLFQTGCSRDGQRSGSPVEVSHGLGQHGQPAALLVSPIYEAQRRFTVDAASYTCATP